VPTLDGGVVLAKQPKRNPILLDCQQPKVVSRDDRVLEDPPDAAALELLELPRFVARDSLSLERTDAYGGKVQFQATANDKRGALP
jgi:hypothetical protein